MSAPRVLCCSIPRTAFVIGNVGSSSCALPSVRVRSPPGYPVYRVYSLPRSLAPLTLTLEALITTTWSPVFRCGVKVGLCLPRRIAATPDARRPRTWSVASTTYQSLFKSAAFAVHVFCLLISGFLVYHFHQCQPPGGGRARRLPAVARPEDLSHPLRRTPGAAHLGQRAGDATREAAQESFRDQVQLDEIPTPRHAGGAHLAHPRVCWLGGRTEAGPVVLADQRRRRLGHRIDVKRPPDVPGAPPLQGGSRRTIEVPIPVAAPACG